MEGHPLTEDPAHEVRFEPLAAHHEVLAFDCGRPSLNDFLQKFALHGPNQGLSQSFVAIGVDSKPLGYYTLAITAVARADTTERVAKGMPEFLIPCALLARLAVDRSVQGQGFGDITMNDAMRRVVALGRRPRMADASPGLPLRAVLVHAIDAGAARFYAKWGFMPAPTDPLHLFISVKDLAKSLGIK